MVKRNVLGTLAAATLLLGCAPQGEERSAGSSTEFAAFGNATMNNVLVQSGQANYRIDLARRFAAEVETTINFAFNSAALDAAAQATLQRQAGWIRQFPEIRFKVYGHTDLVGSQGYNQALGLRRAQAAVAYLIGLGIDRSRLEAVVSFGETQPLIVTEGRERANRRTVTEVAGFVGRHPTVLNGKYAEVVFREYVESATQPQTIRGAGGSSAEAPAAE